MALTKIRLGDYIYRSTVNNHDLKYGEELITGVNSQGVFAVPKGSVEGVDLKPYKIVENGAFVYNPTRLELGSIAYRTEGMCIVSHLYMVFYLTEEGKKIIDPIWLYIYFRRKEFCREVTFRNFGSQRPEFNFNDMSDIIVPLPPIETQQKFVDIYKVTLFLSFTLFILSFKSTTIFWNKQEISSKVSEKVFQQHVGKQMKSPPNPQLSPFSPFQLYS